jgi:hypothetical protein
VIVKGVVEAHRGKVEVCNLDTKLGRRFAFGFP